jgi:hypothetical protein
MDITVFSQINYAAVATTSIILFFFGWLWFSALFGTTWVAELAKHNVFIQEPSTETMLTKMFFSLVTNIVISLAMAYLVIKTGSVTLQDGLCLGLVVALGFIATALGSVFLWENRSVKLYLIDLGYAALNSIIAGIILSLWR